MRDDMTAPGWRGKLKALVPWRRDVPAGSATGLDAMGMPQAESADLPWVASGMMAAERDATRQPPADAAETDWPTDADGNVTMPEPDLFPTLPAPDITAVSVAEVADAASELTGRHESVDVRPATKSPAAVPPTMPATFAPVRPPVMRTAIAPPDSSSPRLMPPGSFVMIGMMRSGSNFLERELNLLPDIRCHGELFNPSFVGLSHEFPKGVAGYTRENTAKRNEDGTAFLKTLIAERDRPHFGFRIFLDHNPQIISEVLYDPAVRKVVLTRNLLEAYLSLANARETNVWLTTDVQRVKPTAARIDVNELVTFALRQNFFYNDILTVLHRTGQPFLHIDYTEIKELDRLNEIAAFVGSDHRFDRVEEPIKKQATEPLAKRIENLPGLVEELRKRQLARWFV